MSNLKPFKYLNWGISMSNLKPFKDEWLEDDPGDAGVIRLVAEEFGISKCACRKVPECSEVVDGQANGND